MSFIVDLLTWKQTPIISLTSKLWEELRQDHIFSNIHAFMP